MAKSRIPSSSSADNGQGCVFEAGPEPGSLEAFALPTGPDQAAAPDPGPDPFDPASLRLAGDLNADVQVKRAVTVIPVRKPNRGEFVRTHPDPAYRLTTYCLEHREDATENYLVAPQLGAQLAGVEKAVSPRTLVLSVNRHGVPFLWPLRPAVPGGRRDEWARSALEAAELATRSWVRVEADMAAAFYVCLVAQGQLPEPEWPTLEMREVLRVAFRDRFITTADHPVLRKLRGEV